MSILGIDTDYLKGTIDIPFNNKNEEDFQANYIDVYEKEYLIRVLGYDLYKRFKEGLEAQTVEQKWEYLKSGTNYEVEVDKVIHTVNWPGFVNDELISVIVYYVYYKWLGANNEQLTGLGVGVANKENATNYDKNKKMVDSWNAAVDITGSECGNATDNTLYNYLNNHQSDYKPIIFDKLEYANILGF